jgi:hypothetical protein
MCSVLAGESRVLLDAWAPGLLAAVPATVEVASTWQPTAHPFSRGGPDGIGGVEECRTGG